MNVRRISAIVFLLALPAASQSSRKAHGGLGCHSDRDRPVEGWGGGAGWIATFGNREEVERDRRVADQEGRRDRRN